MIYPKGERVWAGYYDRAGNLLFIVTSKENSRDWYYLYEPAGDKFKKLGKAKSPPELENKYHIRDRMFA